MGIERIKREETVFIAVDFQERLLPVMAEADKIEKNVMKLVKGLKVLGVPIFVSQQYTKGLGKTVEPIAGALGEFEPVEKSSFSLMREGDFSERLEKLERKTVILAGIETHICVEQTAIDLIEKGYTVFLTVDGTGSRDLQNKVIGLMRLEKAGVIMTSTESVLFELLGGAKEDGFKEISAIVK